MIQLGDNRYLRRIYEGEEFLFEDIAKEYHDEVFPAYPYNEGLLMLQLGLMLTNPGVAMWGITDNGKIVGVIAFVITPPFGGGPLTATEILWFVQKDYRGSSIGVRALLEAEKYLIENEKCEAIEMAAMASSMPEKVGNFLVRRGYRVSEVHYRKVVEPLDPHGKIITDTPTGEA